MASGQGYIIFIKLSTLILCIMALKCATHLVNGIIEVRIAQFQPLSIRELECLNNSVIGEHPKVFWSEVIACTYNHQKMNSSKFNEMSLANISHRLALIAIKLLFLTI